MPPRAKELASAPLLAGLAGPELDAILAAADSRSVAGGYTLFGQGEPAEALHLVAAGRFKLTQLTSAGDELIVRVAGPGDAFAAIAVLDGRAYPFSAVALEPSRVVSWPRRRLPGLLRQWPRLESNVMRLVGEHAREALDRFREVATEPVPQRIARALLRLARSQGAAPEGLRVERITHREIAEMAATTLYTVSRTLSEWEAQGIVEARRGRVLIRAPARLAQVAGIDPAGSP